MWYGILMFLIGVLLCAQGDERDWIAVVRSRWRMEIVI